MRTLLASIATGIDNRSAMLGFNKLGLVMLGFNKLGFNKLGFNKLGFNKLGFNKLGFNKLGFNKLGFVMLGLAFGCAGSRARRRETTPPVLATSVPVIETPPVVASTTTPIDEPPAVASDTPDVFAALALLPKVEQIPTPAAIGTTFGVKLSKLWATKVGRTTFRTTMALALDTLIIGTHGDTLDKLDEATDGIYLLEAATGKRKKLIRTPGKGDLDIGGIAVEGGRVFFTSDNGMVGAFSLTGPLLWSSDLGGKVRPAPALGDLDGDGDIDMIAGNEHGVLTALDGASGKPLWSRQTGENDFGAKGYVGAAAIGDVDGDGIDDVIAGGRHATLDALRGRDGHVLWTVTRGSGMHASPGFADLDGDGKREIIAAWSYGEVLVLDPKDGRALWGAQLSLDGGGIEGLFGSPVPLPGNPGMILQPSSWWNGPDDGVIGVGPIRREVKSSEGRVSATAAVIDLDGDGNAEGILGTEAGVLIALSTTRGREQLAKLGGKIEAPVMLADTDNDGTVEVLVASNDGMLTCFGTGLKRTPIISRFRGDDPRNRGDYGATHLHWTAPKTLPIAPQDLTPCCVALETTANSAPPAQTAQYLGGADTCRRFVEARTDRRVALDVLQRIVGRALPKTCR
jgi:outer membrane protein assembly factor BamB